MAMRYNERQKETDLERGAEWLQTERVDFEGVPQQAAVFGACDANVKAIENALGVAINLRDSNVEVRGEDEANVKIAVDTLEALKLSLIHI